jgi:dextranase
LASARNKSAARAACLGLWISIRVPSGINYVQFYDWQWKHHVPLAGAVTNPATSWTNVANLTCYRQTVQDMISACHSNGMYAMEYNLMYGAWAGYGQDGSGVDSNWALLRSINGPQWSINMPSGWATPTIYIFNPGNTNWQNYLFGRENDVFSDYGFDGWHLDQLGDWGTMYDVSGNSVDVWTTFVGFLNNAKAATGKRLTFNNVGAYGMYSVCAETSDDAVYVECWPANGQTTYQDLKTTIDNGISWSGGKSVVLAAYMDTDLTSGNFSAPGVLLTDASIFASGGTHLELGDGGYMLSTPYFPNTNVVLSSSLANTLTNYYNFIYTNQTYLYGGFANSGNIIWTSIPSSGSATNGEVWAFCKVKGGVSMLNLINLIGETNIDWQDVNGTYPVPTAQTNFSTKYYYGSTLPSSVNVYSPDINNGTAQSLSFTHSSDSGGNYVLFTVPSLVYWDMIIVQ